MAAVALEQLRKLRQRGEKIEPAVGTRRSLAMLPVQADQKGRAAVFLAQARGDNADNTLMPILTGENDGAFMLLFSAQAIGDLAVDLRFRLLPFAVEAAQRLGKLLCLSGILGQK